jgi:hypothetical protein
MISESQKKHIGEARIAAGRAGKWAERADLEGLVILAGFWREVENMLTKGIELQYRALNDMALLNQASKTVIDNQKRSLFDGPNTETKNEKA